MTNLLKEGDALDTSSRPLLSYVASLSKFSFYPAWTTTEDKMLAGHISNREMVFDSSKVNNIYADSIVQPYAIRTRVLISY